MNALAKDGVWDAARIVLLAVAALAGVCLAGLSAGDAGALGVLLAHEGYGHVCFQDPSICVEEAMAAYLTELITPPSGTVCQSDHLPSDPDFG